ncbi:hypothetical protein C1645_827406 [Glomus cerebriforme]|uniref:Uncharacterized protein n=1 Tax=Glomus cerebriforme TaxID=658196 RepID=A0A397SY92_9GLOM|nr:hypothetical protein C1645_827406 [Glomus cerebriforme]
MSDISPVNTSATTLVAAQMTNITLEEKRNLLFDVNCFLEVQMEDFTKIVKVEFYKDSSNYTHSLLDIDRIKHPQAIQTLVEKEAVKNYLPRQLLLLLKNMQQLN